MNGGELIGCGCWKRVCVGINDCSNINGIFIFLVFIFSVFYLVFLIIF